MAFTFPLSVADFVGAYRIHALTLDIPPATNASRTSGGELLPAAVGTRLWSGSITLSARRHNDSAALEAMISMIEGSGGSFYMTDVRRPGPTFDPSGMILGAASPTISALASNNVELSVAGFPAGYVLSRGDMLAFDYLTSPTRRALHRIVTGGIAASDGSLANIQVSPHIRPGAATGAALTFHGAACKAIIVPGSVTPAQRMLSGSTGISFKFQQTLR